MTLGSFLKRPPVSIMEKMMEFFALMEQNIIMRFDGILANNISVPKNARLEKWLPQNDLLEHKNTVSL